MSKPKTAMVMAAGRGVRMGALTKATPKPLLKIAGRPIIDYGIDSLVDCGIRRIVVNLHHKIAIHVGIAFPHKPGRR